MPEVGVVQLAVRSDLLNLRHTVIERVQSLLDDSRRDLQRHFTANVARPRMPEPFVIDLTPPVQVDAHELRLDVIDCGGTPRGGNFKVAALRCGVPETWYQQHDSAYQLDSAKAEVLLGVTRAATRAASEAGASMVVLPEAFMPASARDELVRLTAERGIILVGGVEMHRDQAGVVNRALVVLPSGEVHEQLKQRPSVYEVRVNEFAKDGQVHTFQSSEIGNFAVVVCSDYLEHDFMTEVERSGHVDLLLVCSRNPNPGVFAHLAAADAYRHYCNVVISNSRPEEASTGRAADGDGTLAAAPRRQSPFLDPEASVELGFGNEFAPHERPSLAIFELSGGAIANRNHNRPDHGYISSPYRARRT